MSLRRRLITLYLLLFTQICLAVKVGEAELPDRWPLATQTLQLNGSGIREYGFFKVAVYAAALYTVKQTTDAAFLLSPATTKVIHLKMFRAVSREDSVKAWRVYLKLNCAQRCSVDTPAFASFLQYVTDVKVGDTQTYVFESGKLTLFSNGQLIGDVQDSLVSRIVLESWIGLEPTTEELKQALLGKLPTK
jgi:Chalcone isomerase-like